MLLMITGASFGKSNNSRESPTGKETCFWVATVTCRQHFHVVWKMQHLMALGRTFISQFIYFYEYSIFKRFHRNKSGNKAIGARDNLLVAIAAAACTVVVTQSHALRAATGHSFFEGTDQRIWLALHFFEDQVFYQLKLRVLKKKHNEKRGKDSSPIALSAFSAFVLGAVSKCVATWIIKQEEYNVQGILSISPNGVQPVWEDG
ncbi:hypothetical protein MLD38_018050 [Melastoma candidum]|uniref:Uncharacterized protein n=1 Tax=Melastoma candidum TaxID=119954 RepID=A0ACB9QS20_9MYRT|nr:hypothetical protein MLD38_018050 [Melastoma candidum]